MGRQVELYYDISQWSRVIWLFETDGGGLLLREDDLGETADQYWGGINRERHLAISPRDMDKLAAALDVQAGSVAGQSAAVFAALTQGLAGDPHALDTLAGLCRQAGIPVKVRRVG